MPSTGQENFEIVMIDFFGALRRGDFEAASELLDLDAQARVLLPIARSGTLVAVFSA